MRKIVIVCALALTACSDPEGARKALLDDGIEPEVVGGYSWFGCGNGDVYSTRFEGTRYGRKISGVVCSGFSKGHTIRYD
jgi:hypothetical protein